VVQGSTDKLASLHALCAKAGVDAQQCSFMGDDLPDLEVMRACGLAAAVANAVDAVKQAAHYVTRAAGGHGAVREFSEMVLRAR
jgi:3-deoxy-D-manno-octulosonate 8-phosphate phosphatase (KDO 8-P phosphatase)